MTWPSCSALTILHYSLYTWSAWCPENAEELGIPCSRMFWGVQKQNEFIAQIKAHGCNGQLVFGFNESVEFPPASFPCTQVFLLQTEPG
jgi:hypothetical protein